MKTCKICQHPLPQPNTIYCSRSCYASTLKNTVKKRLVLLDGVPVATTEAFKILDTNAYSLMRMVLDDNNTRVQAIPDKATYIEESLNGIYSRFPNAPTKEQIEMAKANRVPLKTLAKNHGITQTTISNLCLLHGIDSAFQQVDPKVHEQLKSVQDLFDEYKSAEKIATVLGVSPSLVLQKAHKAGVKINPSFESQGEGELRSYIESFGFTTEKRKTKGYEIDIFIPSLNLGFEYNGVYWHSQQPANYHRDKYRKARADGIRLIQIWDVDWKTKPDLIKFKVAHALGIRGPSIGARSLVLRDLTADDVRTFYERTHLQGFKPATRHYGLLNTNGSIIAALSVAIKSGVGKIERYASTCHVTGGFDRLFAKARQDYPVPRWQTFVDLLWSDEDHNQYTRYGFVKTHVSRPNYFYCRGGRLLSRMNFQKHKLTSFPTYDPTLSETEIMEEAGYIRVFDAGNAVLELPLKPSPPVNKLKGEPTNEELLEYEDMKQMSERYTYHTMRVIRGIP